MNPYLVKEIPETPTEFASALCKQFDADLFFSSPAKAKAICSFCPHIVECRDAARAREEKWGVFGGEDEDDRRTWLRNESTRRYREKNRELLREKQRSYLARQIKVSA